MNKMHKKLVINHSKLNQLKFCKHSDILTVSKTNEA